MKEHYTEAQILINIESLVKLVLTKKLQLDRFKKEFYRLRDSSRGFINQQYDYVTPIRAFLYVMNVQDCFSEILNDACAKRAMQTIFSFKSEIESEIEQFKLQETKNKAKLVQYISDLINHYSKLLFVRVDLFYEKRCQSDVNIMQFKQDIRVLCNRISNKDTCFRDLEGYAWALEQGVKKGYHCHLLLIYNGSKHRNDNYLAEQVTISWKEITLGKGECFNCNRPKEKLKYKQKGTLGIGMIHRNNPHEVKNAINAACYLVKPNKIIQRLRVKPEGMRTFGKGIFRRSSRRGLPPVV